MSRRFSVHVCTLSRQCREYDAPARLCVSTPWLHYELALTRAARFVTADRRLRRAYWRRWV